MIATLWDGPWPNWRVWVEEPGEWLVIEHLGGQRLKRPLVYSRAEQDPSVYRCRGEVRPLTTTGRQGKVVT